jgi:uncharacterized alkaline shock family protein YloU
MSDVINSIFGRANSGATTPGGYPAPQSETEAETVDTAVAPEIVDTEAIEESPADTAETAEDAVETEDRDETDDSDTDEDIEDEAVTEESDEDTAEAADEDTAEDTDSADTEGDDEVTPETGPDENTVEAEAVVAEADVVDEAERVVAAAARPTAGTRGATTIGDDVVVKIVARVARKAEGVHSIAADGVEVAVDGDVATITISLVIEFGHAVKALGEQIRIAVIEAVEQFLGLDVEGVDVHVADIHFPDAD